MEANSDFNDWNRSQLGFGEFQVSQRRGERADAATAYLTKEVRARENLTIVPNARALKIEVGNDTRSNGGAFSGAQGKAAKGVIYAEGNTPDARVVEALLRDPGEGGKFLFFCFRFRAFSRSASRSALPNRTKKQLTLSTYSLSHERTQERPRSSWLREQSTPLTS